MEKASLNIREYNNKQALLFPPCIGDFLKEDDFAHFINDAVDMMNLDAYYKKIPPVGNPSYDPAMMLKITFYAYSNNVYSSRKIEDKLTKDVGYIYLSGMQKPDHKTISEFRRKHPVELENSLKEILKLSKALGMVKFGEISIDSKVMKANASLDKNITEEDLRKEEEEIKERMREYLKKAIEIDEEEDKEYGEDKRGNELPKDIIKREERIKRIKESIKKEEEEKKLMEKRKKIEKAREDMKDKGLKEDDLTDKYVNSIKSKDNILFEYREEISLGDEDKRDEEENKGEELAEDIAKNRDGIEKIKEKEEEEKKLMDKGEVSLGEEDKIYEEENKGKELPEDIAKMGDEIEKMQEKEGEENKLMDKGEVSLGEEDKIYEEENKGKELPEDIAKMGDEIEKMQEKEREENKLMDKGEIRLGEEDKRDEEKSGEELWRDIAKMGGGIKKIEEKEEEEKKLMKKQKKIEEARKEMKDKGLKRINLTDKDSRLIKSKERILAGYRAEIAVDAEEQVIVAAYVTNDENDSSQLIPMIDKILDNVDSLPNKEGEKIGPIKIPADSGYYSGNNLRKLKEPKYKDRIDVYIPNNRNNDKERGVGHDLSSPFHKSKFIYDKEGDFYICPQGNKLYYRRSYLFHGVKYNSYRCTGSICKNCCFYGECTKSKSGRTIWISENSDLVDEMRKKLSTEEGKRIYRKRNTTVEPVFGNISHNLGIKGFILRGLKKVNGEFLIISIVHNLIKIYLKLKKIGCRLKEAILNKEKELDYWGNK